MSTEIIKVLDALCDKIGIAIDWSAENITPQIVDLITRYGRYLLVDSIVGLLFGMFLLAIPFVSLKKAIYLIDKNENDPKSFWYNNDEITAVICVILLIISIIASVSGVVYFVENLARVIKCATIPDIYATEQIIKMLQNGG